MVRILQREKEAVQQHLPASQKRPSIAPSNDCHFIGAKNREGVPFCIRNHRQCGRAAASEVKV
jgi:hypothetical protein